MMTDKQMPLAVPVPGPAPASAQAVRPKNAPRALFEGAIVRRALEEAFIKLDPRLVAKNPVLMVVEVGSAVTTYFWIRGLVTGASDTLFVGQVSLWLWFTVLFANFAEAMAEGRGKAQADALRKTKTDTFARRLVQAAGQTSKEERIAAPQLKKGDLFVCEVGEIVAADGEIVEGVASVDESSRPGTAVTSKGSLPGQPWRCARFRSCTLPISQRAPMLR